MPSGGQKKHAKGRLDKFYHMAKEHGYRSRAAFKLIQLNKKYDFLTGAKCMVDLCAAPGGWMQVATKYMPKASIKIGVDLDPIKPIKGCVSYQCDITTDKCLSLIKKELKHFQADVVLHDGAPNVGTDWNLDAFLQIELTLLATRLATKVLKKGGTFVTKVFRSKDYNSLLFVLNQLFTKVESSKPSASRAQSAEIFLVCMGYKGLVVDEKLLDPKYAFEDIKGIQGSGEAGDASQQISSLKKLISSKKKKAYGYADEDLDKNTLHNKADFSDFLASADPYEFLTKFNQFTIDTSAAQFLKENEKAMKPPADLQMICDDVKVCGRREMGILIKMRHKFQELLKKAKMAVKAKEVALAKSLEEPEDEDAKIDRELEETMKRIAADKRRAAKKDKVLADKSELRKKMSVIATTTLDNDEDLLMPRKIWDELQKKGFEGVGEKSDESDDSDMSDLDEDKLSVHSSDSDQLPEEGEDGSDSEEIDQKQAHISAMDAEMEYNLKKAKDYAMNVDRKMAGREYKKKALIEQQRLRLEDLEEREALDNAGLLDDEVNSDDDSEDAAYKDKEGDEETKALVDGMDKESSGESDIEETDKKSLFVNPLAKKADDGKAEESDEWSQDGEYSDGDRKSKKKNKKKDQEKVLGKRKRKDSIDNVGDFFIKDKIEEVPADDPETMRNKDGYESMDSDDIAATRIIARKMLRKKARTEMIEGSYNRFTVHEDPSSLPTWFVEDESKHRYCERYVPSKAEIADEKEALKAYNARPSKKVEQAKHRKRKRLAKAMQKIKKKATIIADTDINEKSKMKQIQKLYRKEKDKHQESKSYVVTRAFQSSGPKKGGRLTKNVDARMRKDLRNDKYRAKGKKKGGVSQQKKAKVQKGGGRPKQ